MPLHRTTFVSDQINILVGFDGTESKSTCAWSKKYRPDFPYRIALAINQHYPELRSGFYRNKALISLVQNAMLGLDLHVVIEDSYRNEGLVPEEVLGTLEIGDDYLLVDKSLRIHGRLNVWEDLGSKGQFYHDQLILEVVTDKACGKQLEQAVTQTCSVKLIRCVTTDGK